MKQTRRESLSAVPTLDLRIRPCAAQPLTPQTNAAYQSELSWMWVEDELTAWLLRIRRLPAAGHTGGVEGVAMERRTRGLVQVPGPPSVALLPPRCCSLVPAH